MKNWYQHIFILLFLISLFLFGVYFKAKEAFAGITWGADEVLCEVEVSDCSINTKLLPIKIGLYDPSNSYQSSDALAIDHYFVSLADNQKDQLLPQLVATANKNRWPLVTVEPWTKENQNSQTVLKDITAGLYDRNIIEVCTEFNRFNKPIFIRFGHEMERVTGRYPWAISDSEAYIEAYRYFVNVCKQNYSQGFYVWSPAGDNGLEKYYPGQDVVDYVGLSVYGLEPFDQDTYGYFRTFSENFGEKYNRIKKFDKPVMIAELGVAGTTTAQKKWLKVGLEHSEQFPLLKIVVYFNSKDNAGAWGEPYGIPNWSIDRSVFDQD